LLELPAKIDLHWTRLVHFLAVAWVVATVLRSDARLRAAWARPLVLCGQHSLPVFCLSIVLDFAASLWFLGEPWGAVAQLAVNLVGWSLLAGFAGLLSIRRAERPYLAPLPRRPEAV
jgi:hypothetical protein